MMNKYVKWKQKKFVLIKASDIIQFLNCAMD